MSWKPTSLLLLLLLPSVCLAQQKNDGAVIYVTGETTGTSAAICERVLSFDLDTSRTVRSALIRDELGGSYKLTLTWFPGGKGEFKLEYWRVQLNEVLSTRNRKEKLGPELLTPVHDFARETLIGILYPSEAPKNIVDKFQQPSGGYYPISAKRVIRVRGFNVIIQVTDFKLSEIHRKQLNSMHVKVELRSVYIYGKGCK